MSTLKTGLLPKPGRQDQDDNYSRPMIEVVKVGVKYAEGKKRQDFKSLSHNLINSGWHKTNKDFWALKEISFSAYPGEVLGVIGSNGAGKTTLCRVLSGLLRPDKGKIKIRGLVSSLLSLGTGFNNELSGRENIFLNAMMLGYSRSQVEKLYPAIYEFSGLGHFIEQPIKHYSTGMKARLGFSIAATLEADILVIDEVLGTGDLEFRKKAAKKIQDLVKDANLVIIVSHNLRFIEENCTRAIWIDEGDLKAAGEPTEITALYRQLAAGMPKKKKIVSFRQTETEAGEQAAIEVKNLGLQYMIKKKPFWALNNVSFKVLEKEIIGIIGPNGAGKSTLCKTLCGILKEDSGTVHVNGNIAALLSFGTGFNQELSGRDNIYLNGMMLGFSRRDMQLMEKKIIEFTELGSHIDKPVKNYSTGMRARLGFSIASMLRPDIFIVDEALSAGDIAFQEKATTRMQEMLKEAKSVIVVTHSLELVEKVCTRAMWFNKGELKYDGEPSEASRRYKEAVIK